MAFGLKTVFVPQFEKAEQPPVDKVKRPMGDMSSSKTFVRPPMETQWF